MEKKVPYLEFWRKNLLPIGNKFFPFRVDPFSEGVSIPLNPSHAE